MVEQEYPKNSASFPESLTVNSSSQHSISKSTFASDITHGSNEDFRNTSYELYHDLSPEEFLCPDFRDSIEARNELGFQDALLSDELFPFDLNSELYNDKCISQVDDYWQPLSERISSISDPYFEASSPLSLWGSSPLDLETLKMDDVFQVDKDDIVQGPTLAQLNSNVESENDSINEFDTPSTEQKWEKSVLSDFHVSKILEKSALKPDCEVSVDKNKSHSEFTSTYIGDSMSNSDAESLINSNHTKTNSSSDSDFKDFQADLNTKKSTKSVVSFQKPKSEIVNIKKSKITPKLSSDNFESEDDSEMDYEYSSDDDSEDDIKMHIGKQGTSKNLLHKKKSRYFWQYNIQSKGPKVPKMKLDGKSEAKGFRKISDPVFSSNYLTAGIQHAGKARRGDGNDLTPNPQKLYNIGLELEKLTAIIEGLVPANELPEDHRSNSRKEKNKLASRACRLKKKAQHEANKLKLFGLQREQKQLLSVIIDARKMIIKAVCNLKKDKKSSAQEKIEEIAMRKCYTKVAGCSAEFVNKVLKNVDSGDKTGGLDIDDDAEY